MESGPKTKTGSHARIAGHCSAHALSTGGLSCDVTNMVPIAAPVNTASLNR